MKKPTLIIIGLAVAVAVSVGGGIAYSAITNRPLVSVAEAANAPLNVTVSASGVLVPGRSQGVYGPTAGTLASVSVTNGAAVGAGQVLATMDPTPLRLAVSQAQAAYAAALAQSAAVGQGVPTSAERSAAQANLSAARSQASTAALNYSAYLAQYNAATPAQQAAMASQLRTLKSATVSANAAVKTAQAQISRQSRSAQVSAARASANQSIAATAAALRVARANLANATLKAPFAGNVIVNGTVEPGAAVVPGVALFTVVDPKGLDFKAAVNQSDIAGVATGQRATITLDAFDQPFAGVVKYVEAAPTLSTTGSITYPVHISINPGSSRLLQGMSGAAEITTQTIARALTVPVESVVTQGSTSTVFVIDGNGFAHAQPVTVGASTDSAVQILNGLSAGQQVATTGAPGLVDGQQVRVQ